MRHIAHGNKIGGKIRDLAQCPILCLIQLVEFVTFYLLLTDKVRF